MPRVTATQAKTHFGLYVDKARNGETIEIVKKGREPVYLVSKALMNRLSTSVVHSKRKIAELKGFLKSDASFSVEAIDEAIGKGIADDCD